MSFGLIGPSSSSLLLSHHYPVLSHFIIFTLSYSFLLLLSLASFYSFYIFSYLDWWFFTSWCIRTVISPTLLHLWHWLRDFNLRGCLMGGTSCVRQWFESLFILCSFSLGNDSLMVRVCTFVKKKLQWYVRTGYPTPLSICSYLKAILLGLSLRVCASFPGELFTIWVTFVIQLEWW